MSKNTPLVTAIVPLYNHAKYVSSCVYSILYQTYKNIEIIIVDDFSTDNPEKHLIHILKNPRVKYLKNDKNMGVSFSRNKAIRLAQGEYICLVDADDFLINNSVEKRLSYLSQSDNLWVFGRCYILFNGKRHPDTNKYERWKKCKDYENSSIHENVRCVSINTVLLKKEFFKILGMFEEDIHYGEDHDLWRRAFSFKKYPLYIEDFIAVYRMHKDRSRHREHFKFGERYFKESASRLEIRLRDGINSSNTIML